MSGTTIKITAIGALTAAAIAWSAAFWFGLGVLGKEDALVLGSSSVQQAVAREASIVRLHALIRGTKNERAELKRRSSTSISEVVDAIERVKNVTGVELAVLDAAVAGALPGASTNVSVLVVVGARGSFAALAHVVGLLEIAPLPVRLQGFEFEKTDDAGAAWVLTARVRALTTPDI